MYFNVYNNVRTNSLGNRQVMSNDNLNKEDRKEDPVIINLTERISSLMSLNDANRYCDELVKQNSSFERLANNVYKYKDYYVNTGKKFKMLAHSRGLQRVNPLGLSCAPELVAYSELINKDDFILVTRISGTEGSTLIPYRDVASTVPVEAKLKFMSDVDKLAEGNVANMAFHRPESWYYQPDTQKIVVSDWSRLPMFDESDKQLYRKNISERCGLIY